MLDDDPRIFRVTKLGYVLGRSQKTKPSSRVLVFDIESRQLVCDLDLHNDQFVSFSPDGKRLAVKSNTIRLWDATQGGELPLPLLRSLSWCGKEVAGQAVVAPDWSHAAIVVPEQSGADASDTPREPRQPNKALPSLLYWSIPKPLDLEKAK